MTRDELSKNLRGIKNRILLAAGKGELKLVDDDQGIQEVQIEALKGEILSEIQHFMNFGFTSVAPDGSEVAFVALGGKRDNAVVLGVDHPDYRVTGQDPGTVVMHGLGMENQWIKMDEDGETLTIQSKYVKIIGTGGAGAVDISDS